jgi:uncharacterized protein
MATHFTNMMLIVTEGCNFRCTYCYERTMSYQNDRTMSWPIAKSATKFFFAQVPQSVFRTSITFFGGEPMLRPTLISQVVTHTYGHRTITGDRAGDSNFVLNTNGTLLPTELYDLFCQLRGKVTVRLSVGGYGHAHDGSRRLTNAVAVGIY